MRILREARPSSLEFKGYEQIGANAAKILGGLAPLDLTASASSLEISCGRFDAGDDESRWLLKGLINACSSFEFFYYGIATQKCSLERIVSSDYRYE